MKLVTYFYLTSYIINGFAMGDVCMNSNRLIYMSTINTNVANNITIMHNNYRLLIAQGKLAGQPLGVNLRRLYYDSKLADHAKAAALECTLKSSNIMDERWYSVGQNSYLEYTNEISTDQHWETAIASWFDEHLHYTFPDETETRVRYSTATIHYTQLVWADTLNIGCHFVIYHDKSQVGKTPYGKLYTCLYGPGGNINNKAPYEVGISDNCSQLC